MEHFKNLLDFINELNESGRIQYDDYSRLFDLAEAFSEMEQELDAAKTDIAALLWLNGDCQYCAHGEKRNSAARTGGIAALGAVWIAARCGAAWNRSRTRQSPKRPNRLLFVQKRLPAWSVCSEQKKPGIFQIGSRSRRRKASRSSTRAFFSFAAANVGNCTAFVQRRLSPSTSAGIAVALPRCTTSHRCNSTVNAVAGSSIRRMCWRTPSPITALPAERRSIWRSTKRLTHIRRCCDARHHRSCQRSDRTSYRDKGANRPRP